MKLYLLQDKDFFAWWDPSSQMGWVASPDPDYPAPWLIVRDWICDEDTGMDDGHYRIVLKIHIHVPFV